MRRIIGLIILLIILVTYSKRLVLAELVINEIYPAPPPSDGIEWVEIYNNENNSVNIQNFYLTDSSGKKILITNETLGPYSFTIASTPSGVLNNSNQTGKNYADIVYLYNTDDQSINIATYSGSFDENKTFAKCPDGTGSWFTLNATSKQSSNNSACAILTPSPTPTTLPTATPTPTLIPTPTITINLSPTPTPIPTKTLPIPTPTLVINKIYLSEIMANPNTGENEWAELYNDNDYSVTLDSWMIDDQTGAGATPYHFSLIIPAHEYNSVNLSKTMFNNDGDQVNLYNSNNELQDSFEYQKSEKNISLGRTNWEDDDFCEQNPSKNLPNNSCLINTSTQNPTPILTLVPTMKIIKKITNIVISPKPQTSYSIQNKNVSSSYFPNQTFPLSINDKTNYESNVLGLTSDFSTQIRHLSIINYLSFLSMSYSFLTIGGILAKIKRWS